MMKMVKDTFYSLGDRSGDAARTFGAGTADLAKRFGTGTANVARQIGPRRGLIGLAVLAAAIGGAVILVRYLRAREREEDLGMEGAGEEYASERTARMRKRAQHRAEANMR